MDMQQILLLAISASCAALGWFARQLYAAIDRLKDDLGALRVLIAEDYVRYDRLHEALKPIVLALDEIKASLNHKADKKP